MRNIYILLFALMVVACFALETRIQAQNYPPIHKLRSGSNFNERPPRNAFDSEFSQNKRDKRNSFHEIKNALKEFVKLEKKHRATSKNIKTRWHNFLKKIMPTHGPIHCVISKQKSFDISNKITKNSLKNAAKKYHQMILELDIKKIESCWKSYSANLKIQSNLTFEQLREKEKKSPTTISNIRERWPMFIGLVIKSGKPEKFLPPMGYFEKLPFKTRLKEQVKVYKQALSSQDSQSYPTIVPLNYEVVTSTQRQSVSLETDKQLATEFFHKAMQYYAKGELEKAKNTLESARNLDSENKEILNSLKRVKKDIAIKNK